MIWVKALQRGYYICETLQAAYHVIIRLQDQSQKIWAVHYKETTTFVKLHKCLNLPCHHHQALTPASEACFSKTT